MVISVGWAELVVTDELVTHVRNGEAVGERSFIEREVGIGSVVVTFRKLIKNANATVHCVLG